MRAHDVNWTPIKCNPMQFNDRKNVRDKCSSEMNRQRPVHKLNSEDDLADSCTIWKIRRNGKRFRFFNNYFDIVNSLPYFKWLTRIFILYISYAVVVIVYIKSSPFLPFFHLLSSKYYFKTISICDRTSLWWWQHTAAFIFYSFHREFFRFECFHSVFAWSSLLQRNLIDKSASHCLREWCWWWRLGTLKSMRLNCTGAKKGFLMSLLLRIRFVECARNTLINSLWFITEQSTHRRTTQMWRYCQPKWHQQF